MTCSSSCYNTNKNATAYCLSFQTTANVCWLCVTGASFGYGLIHCQLTSTQDVVYLEQIYFNKVLIGQYNSTSGNFTGYTKNSKVIADQLNKFPAFLEQERKNEESCRTNIPLMSHVLLKSGDFPYSVRGIRIKHDLILFNFDVHTSTSGYT